jgi:hypothetical protein
MEALYSILTAFGVSTKLVRLIKICLNETYSKAHIIKHLSDSFPIQNGLKQEAALSPPLFNFALVYATRKVQVNQVELKYNGIHQLVVYADENLLGNDMSTIYRTIETLIYEQTLNLRIEVEYALCNVVQNKQQVNS